MSALLLLQYTQKRLITCDSSCWKLAVLVFSGWTEEVWEYGERGDRVVEEVSGYLSVLLNFKGQCRPLLMSRLRFSSSSSYLQSLAQIIFYTYTNTMEETKWNMMQLLESKFVTDPPHCERLPSSGASIIKPTKLLNNIDLQHHRSVTQIQKEGYIVYVYILHIFTFSRGGKLKSSPKRGNVSDHNCIMVVGMCGSSYHICTK
jgi:hypothetical protein